MDQRDPSQMRISDDDRHRMSEILRDAAAEGRIDLEELEERLEAAYAAKVYADLVPLTLDLPGQDTPGLTHVTGGAVQPTPRAGTGVPASDWQSSFAVMWGVERRGVWDVPPTHTAFAMMGSVEIDLREARFTAPETIIYANAIMGSVEIFVNARTHVVVEGAGVMGEFEQYRDRVPAELDHTSPVVRVKGFSLMGSVSVVRKRMPGEPRRKRLRG